MKGPKKNWIGESTFTVHRKDCTASSEKDLKAQKSGDIRFKNSIISEDGRDMNFNSRVNGYSKRIGYTQFKTVKQRLETCLCKVNRSLEKSTARFTHWI